VIKKPDDALLAFLLGTAIGVMFLLSMAEMWIHNALQHGWPAVTAAVLGGALLYQVVQPFLPDFKYDEALVGAGPDDEPAAGEAAGEGGVMTRAAAAAAAGGGGGEASGGKARKKAGARHHDPGPTPSKAKGTK
jgi:ZIP family zinc transporter